MKPSEILTRELLVQEYLVNKLSTVEIAKKFNIKSDNSVAQYIKKYDLHRPNKKIAETYITKEELYQKYIIENKGLKEIANEIGFKAKHSIKRLLKKYDIDIRTKSATKKNEDFFFNYRKHKWITGKYWANIKSGARQINIEFDINIEQAWNQFEKQNGKCAISGVLLRFRSPYEDKICQTASLDRIDSNKGYTINNIQWVHKTVNRIKWALSQDEFIEWCKIIAENNK